MKNNTKPGTMTRFIVGSYAVEIGPVDPMHIGSQEGILYERCVVCGFLFRLGNYQQIKNHVHFAGDKHLMYEPFIANLKGLQFKFCFEYSICQEHFDMGLLNEVNGHTTLSGNVAGYIHGQEFEAEKATLIDLIDRPWPEGIIMSNVSLLRRNLINKDFDDSFEDFIQFLTAT